MLSISLQDNAIPNYFNVSSESEKYGFMLPFYISHDLYLNIINYEYTLPNLKSFTQLGHLLSLIECCCDQVGELNKTGIGDFSVDCFNVQGNIVTINFILSIKSDSDLMRFQLDCAA